MKRVLFRIFLLCAILLLFVACGESAPAGETVDLVSDVGPSEETVSTVSEVGSSEETVSTVSEIGPSEETVSPEPVVEPVVVEPEIDWAAVNAEKVNAVNAARSAAVVEGARYRFWDEFSAIDAAYAEAYAACEASGNPEEFGEIADEFINIYTTFKFLGMAQSEYDIVTEKGYGEFEVKNLVLAEAAYEEFLTLYEEDTPDYAALLEKAKDLETVLAQVVANGKKIDEILAVYDAAIEGGAEDAFPEYVAVVDDLAKDAIVRHNDEGTQEEFDDDAANILTLCKALLSSVNAWNGFDVAIESGYDEYDVKNAALAEELYYELGDVCSTEPLDPVAILEKAEEAEATVNQINANGNKIDEIIAAYDTAVEAGAEEMFPEYLDAVYYIAVDDLEYYNTEGTQAQFDADADNILTLANSFALACKVQETYDEIFENGFEAYDAKDIAAGDDAITDAYALVEAYNDGGELSGKKIYGRLALALENYEQVLANGQAIELLLDTRADVIAAGAEEVYPEEFAAVDAFANECLDYFNEGGTQAELDADIDNFDVVYNAFIDAMDLGDKYSYIIARGFDEYDAKNFNAGRDAVNDVYVVAETTFDGAEIVANLEKADGYYTNVINNGLNVAFVLNLRENAIDYGAQDYFPAEFEWVDEYAVSCIEAYNADGTQEELDNDIETCSYLYNSMMVAVDAQDLYSYIVENGYDEFDVKDVALGDKAVGDLYAMAEEPALDGPAIIKKINVAVDHYNQAIANCERGLVVMGVRDEAVEAGAEDYFPDEIAAVDELAWVAVDDFNNGGSQAQLDADFDNFENVYYAFINAAEAQEVYDIVIENGYDEYDVRNFDAGNEAVAEVYEIAYTTFDGEALIDKTAEVKFYYNKILDNVDMCLDVIAVRDEAVEAGAEDYFPVEFAMVDELAWDAVDYYNVAGTQEELEADVANFKNIYMAFIVAVDAQDAYDVVIDEGYDFYDNKNFEAGNRADEKIYEIAYSTFDGEDILDAVHEVDDAFNQVIDNGQMIDEVIAVREDAVIAGAEEFFPYELSVADEYAYEALDYYNTIGTQEELEADAENFTNVYKAFEEASFAAQVYIRIIENDFQSYDRNGFLAAEKAVDELEDLAYSLASGEVLLAKAEEIHAAYDKVVKNAFKKKSDAVRSEYLAVKKDADGIKANVADRQGYANAEAHMKNAEAIFARMSYEAAFAEYTAAEGAMRSVYESVLAKRNAALEALERGRARAYQLSILAGQADMLAPLSNN